MQREAIVAANEKSLQVCNLLFVVLACVIINRLWTGSRCIIERCWKWIRLSKRHVGSRFGGVIILVHANPNSRYEAQSSQQNQKRVLCSCAFPCRSDGWQFEASLA